MSNSDRKGIILAGGSGTRLYPCTLGISKQLLPVYDKPMVYYPMSVLMLAGIRKVLLISTPVDLPGFQRLFGDGHRLGMEISYAEQASPGGLAQAYTIGAQFVGDSPSCLILGDNLFYGQGFKPILNRISAKPNGATIFAYPVKDPERFGIVEYDPESGLAISLEEKPMRPRSSLAVPGLYFYDNRAVEYARRLRPSERGELEITDLNNIYLRNNELGVQPLGRGFAWLDTGTHRSLIEAASFVQVLEDRQGLKIACLEEIAWENGWITRTQILEAADAFGQSSYAEYLRVIVARA